MKAYKVTYEPNCEPEEDVGYFQWQCDAERARLEFIEKMNLKNNGICCSNVNKVKVKEIEIIIGECDACQQSSGTRCQEHLNT